MNPVSSFVIIIAVLLLLGALGEFVFKKTGIPDVVWLMLSGVLAGPVTGVVSPDMLKPAVPYVGAIALIVILAGGGVSLRLKEVAEAAPRALNLAVMGFLFSLLAMVTFFFITTHLGWIRPVHKLSWILTGAIVGGSSSVVIMPTMAGGKVNSRVARLLEVESTATDTFCIIVTVVIIDLILTESMEISQPFLALARELGFGLGVGVLTGMALMPLIPAIRSTQHVYTIFLSTMFMIYGVLQIIGGNGAVGVLSCALVLGNAPAIMKKLMPSVQEFKYIQADSVIYIHRQMSFMIKAFFFFLIGLMFPTELRIILLGAAAAVFLLLFRIPAVGLSLAGAGFTRQQKALMIFAIPRGIAAGVLSGLPLIRGIPKSEHLSSAIYSLILFSVLIFSVGFAILQRMDQCADQEAQPMEPEGNDT